MKVREMAPDARDWHIITCEYPPRVGGISDYTATVAKALAAEGHRVHVWCPDQPLGAPTPGVMVHPVLGQFTPGDCRRAGTLLAQHPPRRRLFLQWVPHGYGYKSINLPFAIWIAWRAWRHRDELHLMVHEPYMRFSKRPAEIAASLIHRLMFAIVASGATNVWLSIDTWRRYVSPLVPSGTPIEWLPVPAPPVTRRSDSSPANGSPHRGGRAPIVGHFSTHSPVVTRLLAPALDVVLRQSDADVLLMGRDSDRFRERYLATRPELETRVKAAGVLDSTALTEQLLSCDVVLQPFPEGINARHTSALASLALGCCVITNAGTLTEPLWVDSQAVVLTEGSSGDELGNATLDALNDPARVDAVRRAAYATYDRLFDVRHTIAMLDRESGAIDRARKTTPLSGTAL